MNLPSFLRPIVGSIMHGVQSLKLSFEAAAQRTRIQPHYQGVRPESFDLAEQVARSNLAASAPEAIPLGGNPVGSGLTRPLAATDRVGVKVRCNLHLPSGQVVLRDVTANTQAGRDIADVMSAASSWLQEVARLGPGGQSTPGVVGACGVYQIVEDGYDSASVDV